MTERTLEIMVGGRIPVEIPPVSEVKLLELLGVGGFGSVWKVTDTTTNKIYVLKVIQNIEPGSQMAERVRLEASVSIPSEYIVPAIGLRQWNPSTYLLLFEFFAGKSLNKILAFLTPEQKRDIFRQTLVGVGDAHCCNVIHRDLKPANILVGDNGQVKIIDFGISKFKEYKLTKGNELMGTLPYIAPELLIYGAKVADSRTDIYALGHIFYELAIGQHFWVRKRWRQLEDFVNYLNQTPPPEEGIDVRDFCCNFYSNSASVLARMVKLDPNQRFSSINEVMTELGYVPDVVPTPGDLHLRYSLLIVESGSNKGARTLINILDGGSLTIGRTDIAGGNDSISRRHLEFSRVGNQYFVRDVGSKNGTLVRGIALSPGEAPTPIQHSDRIKVGDVFLRFVFLHQE
ncbi:protein kinase [Scytonema sp. UIC 10036]|uniref:FHA domain-containing serine/threonine-protein kinase n=1 Tax=Scytonema sp. UIC 10036 TaxID=2304196 RepID=UPI0012DAA829|nr:FHA domain-containing serine/threonine-protein kinase [Scytonema sp. UIC 10036]MUG98483.1 protein kinase [Scytonema sp. UIC 10036]